MSAVMTTPLSSQSLNAVPTITRSCSRRWLISLVRSCRIPSSIITYAIAPVAEAVERMPKSAGPSTRATQAPRRKPTASRSTW